MKPKAADLAAVQFDRPIDTLSTTFRVIPRMVCKFRSTWRSKP